MLGLLAPVVGVRVEGDLLAALPRVELERAGARSGARWSTRWWSGCSPPSSWYFSSAVGLCMEKAGSDIAETKPANGLFSLIGRGGRVVGRAGVVDRLVGAVTGGEAAEQRAVVVGQVVGLRRLRHVVPAVEVGADRVGVEVGAVLELHVVAQVEGVGQAVLADVPRGRQQRRRVGGAGLGADQALEDLARDPEGLAVGGEERVEARRARRSRRRRRSRPRCRCSL